LVNTYPEKYINIKDVSKEVSTFEPEVILQIKIKGDRRNELLKMVFEEKTTLFEGKKLV